MSTYYNFYNKFLVNSSLYLNDDKTPDLSKLTEEITKWLNVFIVPVCIIIGGLSIYKLMFLGWKIAHSGDRPDERRIAVMAICWWAGGFILCILAPLVVNLILPTIMKAVDPKYKPNTYLLTRLFYNGLLV